MVISLKSLYSVNFSYTVYRENVCHFFDPNNFFFKYGTYFQKFREFFYLKACKKISWLF